MLPTLVTPRLTLRPATEADLDALWRLLTDPQVRRYLCDDRVLTRAEVEEILAESLAQWPGMGLWLLHDHEERLVGGIGLHPDAPNGRSHRLMLRVGFTQTGTTATGPCYPLRTYRLTRSVFAAAGVPEPP